MLHRARVFALVLATLVVGAILATPATAAIPRCFGERATIVGTQRADVIQGTDRRDVIVGLGGGDTIRAKDRRDLVCGGAGPDRVNGGDGVDFIMGEGGDDHLVGGPGRFNQIWPGAGDDFANGGAAVDESSELIYLDAPNGVTVDLGARTATGHGTDTVANFRWLIGSEHDDVLIGSDVEFQVIYGAAGDDVIELLGGDDAAGGGPGDDDVDGGDGFDMLVDSDLADIFGPAPVVGPLTVNLLTGTLLGNGSDTLTDIEGSFGSPDDDVMVGNAEDNDFVRLDEGNDTVDAGGGDDLVDGGDGTDDLDGGPGVDVLGNLDATAGMTIDLDTGTTSHGDVIADFEDVIGTFFDDVIIGDAAPNTIEGTDGADTISGLGGNDVLFGGWDGFDDGSPDSTDGGEGTDQCDAETEINCEADPPPITGTSRTFGKANAVRGAYQAGLA